MINLSSTYDQHLMEKQGSFGEKQDEQLGDLIGSSKEQHIAQELIKIKD